MAAHFPAEVRVLLTYFMDASNTTLCMRSPWEDGEAVEEEMTDTVQLLRGQGPALLPFYDCKTEGAAGGVSVPCYTSMARYHFLMVVVLE
jgi:hypothetical protein